MRVLVDSHALLWWLEDSPHLSAAARRALQDRQNQLLWSLASSWELAIKVSAGRLRFPEPLSTYLPRLLNEQSMMLLPIEHAHALRVSELPRHHKDPFDRMLVAQAQVEGLTLLSADKDFRAYEIEVLW